MKPVKRGNFVVKIPSENILQCDNKVYGIKEKCSSNNKVTICNKNQIINLSETGCIPYLLTSRPPNCTEIDNSHIPAVEEISPGTLLLNKFNGTILVDGEAMDLTGTFIIQYQNATLMVNRQAYTAREVSISKPLPPIVQPDAAFRTFEEVLTLQAMKELHLNNTGHIKLIEKENRTSYLTNFGLTTVALSFLVTTTILKVITKRRRNTATTAPTIETITIIPPVNPVPENQGSTSSLAETPRISQIPYF